MFAKDASAPCKVFVLSHNDTAVRETQTINTGSMQEVRTCTLGKSHPGTGGVLSALVFPGREY
eukprot:3343155-Pyramimonas_sp.AAC.2